MEDRIIEITQLEQQTESQMKRKKNERDIWDTMKHANLCIIGILEGEEREKKTKNLSEEVISEMLLLSRFSCARLCVTSWSAAYQAPPSMGLSRQEYWSGVPLPSPI